MKVAIYKAALIICIMLLNGCKTNKKEALMKVDTHSNSYLTPMGCLRNGPWKLHEYEDGFGYNMRLYANEKEIVSKKCLLKSKESGLTFSLLDNNLIAFWTDNGSKQKQQGSWQVNLADSSLNLNFASKDISNEVYHISNIGNGLMELQQIHTYDSLIGEQTVKIKNVKTYYYERGYSK